MKKQIKYRCAICHDFESNDRSNVKRHISKSEQGKHKRKSGSDPGVIIEVEDDMSEYNPRTSEKGNVTFTGPALDLAFKDKEETTIRVELTIPELVAFMESESVERATKAKIVRSIVARQD